MQTSQPMRILYGETHLSLIHFHAMASFEVKCQIVFHLYRSGQSASQIFKLLSSQGYSRSFVFCAIK